jgi:hypothetical protein
VSAPKKVEVFIPLMIANDLMELMRKRRDNILE